MVLTEFPMVAERREPHLSKASLPMVMTESGMFTEMRPVREKAEMPMDMTELPMTTEVRAEE
eukprot:351680-Prymnesium_polylepis.1